MPYDEVATEGSDRLSILEKSVGKIAVDLSGLTRIVQLLAEAVPVSVPRGGTAEFLENGRVLLTAPCDGTDTLISQTNDRGTTETIRYITNRSDCGNVTIRCLDDLNRELGGTKISLGPNQTIRSYTSPIGASSIVFSCKGDREKKCRIEFDR